MIIIIIFIITIMIIVMNIIVTIIIVTIIIIIIYDKWNNYLTISVHQCAFSLPLSNT